MTHTIIASPSTPSLAATDALAARLAAVAAGQPGASVADGFARALAAVGVGAPPEIAVPSMIAEAVPIGVEAAITVASDAPARPAAAGSGGATASGTGVVAQQVVKPGLACAAVLPAAVGAPVTAAAIHGAAVPATTIGADDGDVEPPETTTDTVPPAATDATSTPLVTVALATEIFASASVAAVPSTPRTHAPHPADAAPAAAGMIRHDPAAPAMAPQAWAGSRSGSSPEAGGEPVGAPAQAPGNGPGFGAVPVPPPPHATAGGDSGEPSLLDPVKGPRPVAGQRAARPQPVPAPAETPVVRGAAEGVPVATLADDALATNEAVGSVVMSPTQPTGARPRSAAAALIALSQAAPEQLALAQAALDPSATATAGEVAAATTADGGSPNPLAAATTASAATAPATSAVTVAPPAADAAPPEQQPDAVQAFALLPSLASALANTTAADTVAERDRAAVPAEADRGTGALGSGLITPAAVDDRPPRPVATPPRADAASRPEAALATGTDAPAANDQAPLPPAGSGADSPSSNQPQASPAAAAEPAPAIPHSAAAFTSPGRTLVAHAVAVDQVAVHVTRAARAGIDRIEIGLQPETLGRIDIRLDLGRDGRVNALVVADNRETLNMLTGDARALQQALQDAGLKADAGSLQFGLRGDHGGASDRNGGGAGGHPQPRAAPPSDGLPDGRGAGYDPASASRRHDGRLDLLA